MNNFGKVYSADTLKKNLMVTTISLPMEESIMVPVSQMIDLMKQGEDILFFSFNHDSIKINEFLVPMLKGESNPETITGGLSIFDKHQIPEGENWIKFVEDTISHVKKVLELDGRELNFVFFDILSYVESTPRASKKESEEFVASALKLLAFTQKFTPVIIKTVDMPKFTAIQKPEQSKEIMDEFMSKNLMDSLKESRTLVEYSDFILSVNRKKKSFWKKVLNFLLFWRKKNNFTLKVLKNRNGNGKSYRMNIDLEVFRAEIL